MADFTPSGISLEVQGLNKFMSGIGKADKGIDSLNRTTTSVSSGFTSLGKNVLKVGAIAGAAATAGIAALGAGVAAVGVTSVRTAISFESAFAGVLKTVDGLTDGIGVLNEEGRALREGFVQLSREVPLAFEELAEIGELGGQLGIPRAALLDFTETVTALGVSTNLSTEEAASGLARMSNIFSIEPAAMGANIEQLGSTIVALGNNFATTERDILAFGERIAGAGAIAGLTQADVFSIGAAMSSVGVQAEAGGTAVQKVLLAINNSVAGATTGFVDYTKEIDKNVEKMTKLNAESARLEAQFPGLQAEILAQKDAFIAAGGSAEEFGRQLGDKTRQKALETAESLRELQTETDTLRAQHGQPVDSRMLSTFARTAELSATEFQELWEEDASEAFRLFVEGLGRQGDDAINTLSDLGLQDQRLIRSFLSLSGAGDLLARSLELGNNEFEENTALANEAAQRYATTESQLAILKNTLRAVADTIGSALLPFFNQALTATQGWINEGIGPLSDILQGSVIPAITNFIGSIQSVITLFQAFGAAGAGAGILAMLGLEPATVSAVMTTIQNLQNTFAAAMPFIQAAVQTAGIIIGAVFSSIMSVISGQVVPNLQAAFDNLTMALNSLGLNWSDVWNAVLTAVGLVAAGIGVALLALVAVITGIISGASAIILTFSEAFIIAQEAIGRALIGIENFVVGFVTGWNAIFAGDLPGAIEAWKLSLSGAVDFVAGVFQLVLTAVTTPLAAIITFLQSFVTTVIDFFVGLSSTLVGNSIIPDMVMAIIESFTGMVEPILSIFSTLSEGIGNILGAIFGGGGGEETAINFNPEEALAGIEELKVATENWNLMLTNITTVTLPLLLETFTMMVTSMIEQLIALLENAIMPVEMALTFMYVVTLPNLQQASNMTTQAMIAGFTAVEAVLQAVLAVVTQITAALVRMAEAANNAVNRLRRLADIELDNLISDIQNATSAADALAAALTRAARAARRSRSSMRSGLGLHQGIGFQAGTPANTGGLLNLGFRVPSGFPNDSFGPLFVESGEEMLVTPRGMSIDSLVLSRLADIIGGGQVADRPVVTNITNNFNMTVNTGASPSGVTRQFEVMRGLVGG